jgi:hypothetical protein
MTPQSWAVLLAILTSAAITVWALAQKDAAETDANDYRQQAASFAIEVDDWRRRFRKHILEERRTPRANSPQQNGTPYPTEPSRSPADATQSTTKPTRAPRSPESTSTARRKRKRK